VVREVMKRAALAKMVRVVEENVFSNGCFYEKKKRKIAAGTFKEELLIARVQ